MVITSLVLKESAKLFSRVVYGFTLPPQYMSNPVSPNILPPLGFSQIFILLF